MAITTIITCEQCGKEKHVTHSVNDYRRICHDCEQKNEEEALNIYLAKCAKKPLEERVRDIEEQLYNRRNSDRTGFGMNNLIG